MKRAELFEAINKILMKWNPIGVEGPSLNDEYVGYVPMIAECHKNREKLRHCLEALIEEFGMEYSEDNLGQRNHLEIVVNEIYSLDSC